MAKTGLISIESQPKKIDVVVVVVVVVFVGDVFAIDFVFVAFVFVALFYLFFALLLFYLLFVSCFIKLLQLFSGRGPASKRS